MNYPKVKEELNDGCGGGWPVEQETEPTIVDLTEVKPE